MRTKRASAAVQPFETTAARLLTALSGYNDEAEASLSMLRGVTMKENVGASARLQRAHERIAQAAVEARAIYAIADAERKQGRSTDLSLQKVIEAGEGAGLFIVSDAPAPKLAPYPAELECFCPACGGRIVTLTATGFAMEVPGSIFHEDGDGIPGAPLKFAECDSAIGAMVGRCPHCASRYWSLEVLLNDAGNEALIEVLCNEPEWDAQFTAGPNWMAYAVSNAAGRSYQHMIGPMLVPEGLQTHGSNGVSACGGGAFWKHGLAVFEAYRARLEAVQRQLVAATANTAEVRA